VVSRLDATPSGYSRFVRTTSELLLDQYGLTISTAPQSILSNGLDDRRGSMLWSIL